MPSPNPTPTELAAAARLLDTLYDYFDTSDPAECIPIGHPIHAAIGDYRESLTPPRLPPEISKLWRTLRLTSRRPNQTERDAATAVAEDLTLLIEGIYPTLASGGVGHGDDGGIPMDRRTRPMSLAEAGMRLGLGPTTGSKASRREAAGKAMRRIIDAGGIRAMQVGTLYVFDASEMPDG